MRRVIAALLAVALLVPASAAGPGVAAQSPDESVPPPPIATPMPPGPDVVPPPEPEGTQPTAVELTPTSTTLVVTPNPVPAGSQATFTATVLPAPSLGAIEWIIDGNPATPTPVGADGIASTTRTWADPGAHAVQARFVEGTVYAESLSDPVALTVAPVGYAVSLTASPAVVAAGSTTHLVAGVAPPAEGTIAFYRDGELLAAQVIAAGDQAAIDPTVAYGSHVFRADFTPTGASTVAASAESTVEGKEGLSLYLEADRLTAVAGQTLVTFQARPSVEFATGLVTFRDVSGSSPVILGSAALTWTDEDGQAATFKVRLGAAGTRTIEATYAGDTMYAPATSNTVTITVSPDTAVSASGVGVSYATFYPYKDGYRDTVAIRGTPNEPVSVSVKVYNSSGRLVRSWSLATRSTKWSIAWNGRTSSGTRLASGKYKVVQRLVDGRRNVRSYTAYTTISNKRLYWYSGSITKYADTGTFGADGYAGAYRSNRVYRAVILDGGYCEEDWETGEEYCDIAVGRHRFGLPAAAAYSSIRFAVLGRSVSPWGVGIMAIEDYTNQELDVARSIGYSWTWYTTSSVGSSGHVSSSRIVTGWVSAVGSNEGLIEYQKVKVTFRYALLK